MGAQGDQEKLREGRGASSVSSRQSCFPEGGGVSSRLLVMNLQGWGFPFLEKICLFIPRPIFPLSFSCSVVPEDVRLFSAGRAEGDESRLRGGVCRTEWQDGCVSW